MTLGNGQSWQKSVTVTENQVGSYSVVFELWQYNPEFRSLPVYCMIISGLDHSSYKLSRLMPFSVLFFDCNPVDIVVCAERYDLQVRRNVVHYASSNSVNVKVV